MRRREMSESDMFARCTLRAMTAGAAALKRAEIEADPVKRLYHLTKAFENFRRCRSNLDDPWWRRPLRRAEETRDEEETDG